ncbi:hypothetical protein [Leuconostoc pseudomesenteroides]|uniref:hypothetical protein n=1 Tax=Leuconostoc pseudomesenteroides TaxID=33968 RepID=UPI00301C11AF
MTFDEAIERILFDSFEDTYNYDVVYAADVVSLLKNLRQEYAPTVEMTKAQNEAFVESVEGIATQERLDSFVDEELDLGDMTVRKGLNAWLHPETIKIVDE